MRSNMNVLQIVKQYLEASSFAGLYNEDAECACVIADLAPCGEMSQTCQAGILVKCPRGCGDHDWHIVSPTNP